MYDHHVGAFNNIIRFPVNYFYFIIIIYFLIVTLLSFEI